MKKKISCILGIGIVISLLAGCSTWRSTADGVKLTEEETETDSGLITVGFVQTGAESNWRLANTESIENTLTEENGYQLLVADGQQEIENQMHDIRKFIQQKVDYIVLAPIIESGWDTVLGEAKQAGIPVIIEDRKVDVADQELYVTWIGSNCLLEGRLVCAYIDAFATLQDIKQVNIVDIQGTIGASSQIGRTTALKTGANRYGWNLMECESGEFTRGKGEEVVSELLEDHPAINVIYCENDDMAMGAVDAIKNAGKTVGPDGDILLVSFDATRDGLQMTLEGTTICNAECNPLIGPQIADTIEKLENGKTVDKKQYVEEDVFGYDSRITSIIADGDRYDIRVLSKEMIDARKY